MTTYDRTGQPVSPPAGPMTGPRCRRCRKPYPAHVMITTHDHDPMGVIEDREHDHIQAISDRQAANVLARLTRELDDLNDLVSQLRKDAGV